MNQNKKIKFAERVKHLSKKFRWYLFTEMQDLKLTSKYIDMICPETKKQSKDPIENLDEMVQESLIKEFTPNIKNKKSFRFLTDAITYRIQRKSIREEDKEEENIS